MCVCPCVSVNLQHAHTVYVSVRELQTVKLMERATGRVCCGKWLHGSVDMCNCSNWLSGVVLGGNKRSSTGRDRLPLTKSYVSVLYVHIFSCLESKIDVGRCNKCAKCAEIEKKSI